MEETFGVSCDRGDDVTVLMLDFSRCRITPAVGHMIVSAGVLTGRPERSRSAADDPAMTAARLPHSDER